MKMTTAMLIIGSLIVFWASTFIMVFLPSLTWKVEPSKVWRPMTTEEKEGQELYVSNGCSYCHTLFIRVLDWGVGAERIAEHVNSRPELLPDDRSPGDDIHTAVIVFHTREPGAYIWLMVVMEMVKEFTSGEAFIVQPLKVPL